MSSARLWEYNDRGFSSFVSPSIAFNFSYAGYGWTTSYSHGEMTVQATAGNIGVLLFLIMGVRSVGWVLESAEPKDMETALVQLSLGR